MDKMSRQDTPTLHCFGSRSVKPFVSSARIEIKEKMINVIRMPEGYLSHILLLMRQHQ
jgi:hypothetical protein